MILLWCYLSMRSLRTPLIEPDPELARAHLARPVASHGLEHVAELAFMRQDLRVRGRELLPDLPGSTPLGLREMRGGEEETPQKPAKEERISTSQTLSAFQL